MIITSHHYFDYEYKVLYEPGDFGDQTPLLQQIEQWANNMNIDCEIQYDHARFKTLDDIGLFALKWL